MKSPFECRRYAEQCRALANGMNEQQRREVLRMADIWEAMACDGENAGKQHLAQTTDRQTELER
jgi:hypothetical protein